MLTAIKKKYRMTYEYTSMTNPLRKSELSDMKDEEEFGVGEEAAQERKRTR